MDDQTSIPHVSNLSLLQSSIASSVATWHSSIRTILAKVDLSLAGIVLLADFDTVARRTASTGTSGLLDAFVLAPGLHRQQAATALNHGEYPACAAMTSGYVFRVENPATVLYMQRFGRTGQLTTLSVSEYGGGSMRDTSALIATLSYHLAILLTLATVSLLYVLEDYWSFVVMTILIVTRLLNSLVVQSRAEQDWKGAHEPGVRGDLLILMSQDRWIRLQGPVDDLKAVTSGQWLEDMTFWQSSISSCATLLVYVCIVIFVNASQEGKALIVMLLLCSIGLLANANECTTVLKMNGRVIHIQGKRISFGRRLDMAKQLIKETGRDDWAIGLGMINAPDNSQKRGPPTM